MTARQLTKFASRFQLLVSLPAGYRIVDYGDGEAGLYVKNFVNPFGTPLAVRGPRSEIEALVKELA